MDINQLMEKCNQISNIIIQSLSLSVFKLPILFLNEFHHFTCAPSLD